MFLIKAQKCSTDKFSEIFRFKNLKGSTQENKRFSQLRFKKILNSNFEKVPQFKVKKNPL